MGKPKVISLFRGRRLQECFPQLKLMGGSQSVFVECQSYDLIMKVRDSVVHELDLFEDAVLRMIQIQVGSVENLAESLALPRDLVKLIIMRLQEKHCLTDPHTVSEQGLRLIEKGGVRQEEATPLMAKLFRIPQTGQLLPYIHIGELPQADVIQDANGFKLEFGSRGSPVRVSGPFVRCDPDGVSRLGQRECEKAIRLYNRLIGEREFQPIHALTGWAIDCSRSERVYFHMQAAIQKGNVDFSLVSDGFVPNIDGLNNYIDQKNEKILAHVRQNALDLQQPDREAAPARQRDTKHQNIYIVLERILDWQPSAESEDGATTRDEIQQENRKKRELLENCAVMLEWVFYYYAAENPISSGLRQELRRGSDRSNAEILIAFARKIGIDNAEAHASLFARVNEAHIRRGERYQTPDFYIDFPLSVAKAGESGGGPMHSLFAQFPDLLGSLDALFRAYRSMRHGSPDENLLPDAERIKTLSCKCVYTLFPEIKENITPGGTADTAPAADASDTRLSARVALERMMGSLFFNSLPSHVQNEWMRISPDKSPNRLPDPYNYINILYRLLEGSLQEALTEQASRARELTQKEGVACAEKNWGGSLPVSLTTVSETYFTAIQRGIRAPLGACTLYYLCTAREDAIKWMKKWDFVRYVDQILTLRRHGNQVGLYLEDRMLSVLRDQTLQFTKYLGGFSE